MSKAAGSLMLVGVLAAVLALRVAPVGATHADGLSDAEVSCQLNTAKAFSKLVASSANCRIKCEASQLKGTPGMDCTAPTYDPTTQACLTAAQTAAKNSELAKCTVDCPECYTGGDPSADADARLAATELQLNIFAPLIYCAEAPTAAELKCESGTAKNAAKLIGSLSKCSQKCVSALHKGAARVCSGTVDPTTQACQDAAITKTGLAINKACATKPTCHGLDGAGWADAVATALSGGASYDSYYCGD